ncbi:MAG TPA: N-acetylmuramoyl-L-alanine amidase [Microvirga sp.]|jgi:N-acetylmuramoyl-L-alanine amidase|nr:N-acetylmuramoyl-L-alanine amidase [Microvirga sp.]
MTDKLLSGLVKPLAALAFCLGVLVAGAGIARAASPSEPRVAAAMEVEVDGARTRLKVTLSHPVTATAHVLERPDRVVIDFPEVAFHLPPETGRKREGLIASYRYGLFAPGRSRVVVDLSQPAMVSRIDTIASPRDGATLLIVELAKADREEFRRAAAESATKLAAPAAEPAPSDQGDRRPVIMLDPGHGGVDPGAAAAGGMVEKDIVFAFAQLFRKKLEAEGRYRVLMTREQDVFVPLGERVRIAQRAKADLFISIHADSIAGGQQDVRGLTIYTGAERASDADSARLADRENQADAVAGLDPGEQAAEEVSDILRDLTLRETRAFSHSFASRLVGELDTVARMNKNPHRQAGFRVLRAHDIPSVLVELGYLSSRKDFDLLMSDQWRERSTTAMTAAVDRFFAKRQALRPALP